MLNPQSTISQKVKVAQKNHETKKIILEQCAFSLKIWLLLNNFFYIFCAESNEKLIFRFLFFELWLIVFTISQKFTVQKKCCAKVVKITGKIRIALKIIRPTYRRYDGTITFI